MSFVSRSQSPPPDYSGSTLKPYLELSHLISLAWLAYPILSLLFIAFRLQLSLDASSSSIASAKENLIASCLAAEKAATSAASFPRYMAVATNQRVVEAVNDTMEGARAALVLSLTVMEAIINFLVDIYRSTFLCFVELVVRGGLSLLITAVQDISTFITGALDGIRTNIQNDVATANSAMQSVIDGINKVNPFKQITAPQFNIPSLDSLQNVTIPTDFEDALVSLNNSLPTFKEIKDVINNLLDTPFELLKKDINDTFAGLSFDGQTLPVPQQNTVVFCDQLDTSVVDDLGKDLIKVAEIGFVILIAVAIILFLGASALEWWKWRCLQRHLRRTRDAWTTDPSLVAPQSIADGGIPTMEMTDHNLMMLQSTSQHPALMRIANWLSSRLSLSPQAYTHLRWFLHYVFHPPALACLLIGLLGILSVQLQLAAVGPLEAKFHDRAQASVADFSNVISTQMNSAMLNQSAAYAADMNGRISTIQNTIDSGLFGWVNGTTTTLNNTLNSFYDEVQTLVSDAFHGTLLEQPVQEFVKCFIGGKVDALEDALTFLNQNLNVQLPRVNDTALVLSPGQVDEVAQPVAAAAIGGGSGTDGGGVVGKIIANYVASLKKERIMFCVFLGLWGFVVLMALGIIAYHSFIRARLHEHKRRKWQEEKTAAIEAFSATHTSPQDGPHAAAWAAAPHSSEKASMSPLRGPSPGEEFFDAEQNTSRSPVEQLLAPARRATQKILALGRKPVPAQEVLVHDGDSARTMSAAPEQERPWAKRMTTLFKKGDAAGALPEPTRPALTVSTSDLSVVPAQGPVSAWSASPSPHISSAAFPWNRKSAAPPPRVPSPPLAVNLEGPPDLARSSTLPPGPRIFAGLPKTPSPRNPFAMPMPLHTAFATPPVASPPARTPTQTLARTPTKTPIYNLYSPTVRTSLAQGHHAKKSSGAIDPFASPFDDPRAY